MARIPSIGRINNFLMGGITGPSGPSGPLTPLQEVDAINPLIFFWGETGEMEAFQDTSGTIPAANGDRVKRVTNRGTGADLICSTALGGVFVEGEGINRNADAFEYYTSVNPGALNDSAQTRVCMMLMTVNLYFSVLGAEFGGAGTDPSVSFFCLGGPNRLTLLKGGNDPNASQSPVPALDTWMILEWIIEPTRCGVQLNEQGITYGTSTLDSVTTFDFQTDKRFQGKLGGVFAGYVTPTQHTAVRALFQAQRDALNP